MRRLPISMMTSLVQCLWTSREDQRSSRSHCREVWLVDESLMDSVKAYLKFGIVLLFAQETDKIIKIFQF